jgi:hypothetical protein
LSVMDTVIHHARRTLLRLSSAEQQALVALAQSKILILSPLSRRLRNVEPCRNPVLDSRPAGD